jgi:hypothetical protein
VINLLQMRRFLLCLVVLALSSCLPVHDFGTYWNKGYVDRAVLGNWDVNDSKKKNKTVTVQVTDSGGAYLIKLVENGKEKDQDGPLVGRTLNAGKYKYILYGSESDNKKRTATLLRYAVKNGMFITYDLKPDSFLKLLHDKYPKVAEIRRSGCDGRIICEPIEIGTLNADVFKILSEIPDTRKYWKASSAFLRAK